MRPIGKILSMYLAFCRSVNVLRSFAALRGLSRALVSFPINLWLLLPARIHTQEGIDGKRSSQLRGTCHLVSYLGQSSYPHAIPYHCIRIEKHSSAFWLLSCRHMYWLWAALWASFERLRLWVQTMRAAKRLLPPLRSPNLITKRSKTGMISLPEICTPMRS